MLTFKNERIFPSLCLFDFKFYLQIFTQSASLSCVLYQSIFQFVTQCPGCRARCVRILIDKAWSDLSAGLRKINSQFYNSEGMRVSVDMIYSLKVKKGDVCCQGGSRLSW